MLSLSQSQMPQDLKTTPDRRGQLQGINGATAHCSYRKPSDRGISYALLMQSLAFAMAIDDRLAMLPAMERASGMSWFKLTTLLTRPAVCASAAVSLCVQGAAAWAVMARACLHTFTGAERMRGHIAGTTQHFAPCPGRTSFM